MHELDTDNPKSKDFMWELTDARLLFNIKRSYHLHGALYLWRDAWSATEGKRIGLQKEITQTLGGYGENDSRRPLFVSEGDSDSKRKAILNSRYLTFCLDAFREDSTDTIVFGHSLSDQDNHVVDALRWGEKKKIAISIFPGKSPAEIQEDILRFEKQLSGHYLYFFNSTTHPLGNKEPHIASNPVSAEGTE